MRAVVHVLVAAEEDGIEEGRCELTRASADVHRAIATVDLSIDDRSRGNVPLRCGSLTDVPVQRERCSGRDDDFVRGIGDGLDVAGSGSCFLVAGPC